MDTCAVVKLRTKFEHSRAILSELLLFEYYLNLSHGLCSALGSCHPVWTRSNYPFL